MRKVYFVFVFLFFVLFAAQAEAANHYVRSGASGNGSDWANAYGSLPSSLVRGDTYYIAAGNYSSYTFDDAQSGTSVITVKKATASDHGTGTGWSGSYGTGQAVFSAPIALTTGYYIIDGNGTHTIPSNNTNDYGIKISSASSSNTSGIVQIGAGGSATYITLRYVHVYNTTNGSTCGNGTVGVRWTGASNYAKLQNCYFQNSGKDGLQISGAHYVLLERSYIERYGKLLPDCGDSHGQTVQMFWGPSNIVFRWNVWESNEGQSLISYGDGNQTFNNFRFYGNVVFSKYNTKDTAGFNISGGLIGNPWGPDTINNFAIYNNTIVNQRASYTTTGTMNTSFPIASSNIVSNVYGYNNLFYNSESSSFPRATAYGYNASGGYGTAGGTNEQTGLSSGIFQGYSGNDYRLISPTAAGLALTSQSWWNAASNSFFGQLDYNTDMYGNARGADGAWDRGAYEYGGGSGPTPTPTPSSSPTPTPSTTPTPTPTPTPGAKKGDLNNSGKVDVTDLGILLSNWGATSRPAADINQDGRVDVTDLGILLSNWG